MPVRRLPLRLLRNIGFQLLFRQCGDALSGLLPQRLVGAGAVKAVSFQQGLDIQSRAADENGDGSLRRYVGNSLPGHLAEQGRRIGLVRLGDVDEVMGITAQLVGRRLGRTDVHAFVNLIGIAGNELRMKMFGQGKAQGRLADGRRADNCNYFLHLCLPV